MRVLVTGGAGFVGSHVVDALLERGVAVLGLDLLHPAAHAGRPPWLAIGAEWSFGDVRDAALLEACLEGVDAVCHQAAMVGLGRGGLDVEDYVAHNDAGTAALLAALHRRRFAGRVVLASSMVVYGEGAYACPVHGTVRPAPRGRAALRDGAFEPACPDCARALAPSAVGEDAPTDPRNVYAATKLHQEHLCAAVLAELGAPLTVLRYHNVYGPRMPRDTPYAGVASIFRSALQSGRAPRVFEDGGQLRDFVHVADVARANVLALLAPEPVATTLNVASGVPRSVLDMARALAGPDGVEPEVTGEFRLGDVRHVFASAERARALLDFRAEVAFADGMAEFRTAPLREPPG